MANPEKIILEKYEKLSTGQFAFYCTRGNGDPYYLVVMPGTLEWRAGEYNLDPDPHKMLDFVLHEMFIPQSKTPGDWSVFHEMDGRKGAPAHEEPTWLYNASSIDEARDAHLARIEYTRKNVATFVERDGKTPIKDFLDDYQMNPEPVPHIRRHVAEQQRSVMADKIARKARSQKEARSRLLMRGIRKDEFRIK